MLDLPQPALIRTMSGGGAGAMRSTPSPVFVPVKMLRSLRRRQLSYLEDGALPIDNNWVENQIRPIAIGRNNWLFTGSLRAGKRAAKLLPHRWHPATI
jgi:hypothetical protein